VQRGFSDDMPDGAAATYPPQLRESGSSMSTFQMVPRLVLKSTAISSTGWSGSRKHCQSELGSTDLALICGDFNIAPTDADLHDPVLWSGKILCSEAEREALESIRELGLYDLYRKKHPEGGHCSWWDYRTSGFRRNHG
jgi:hypothetical protein